MTDNVATGETYDGKYFSLTSGIGSDVNNIGNATNQFKGIATLGAGVKVSFNGGATIEVTNGEISFNVSDSTFGSLDNGDKFKVDDTEYTVGDGCILQSGKVWLNPAQVTIAALGTADNWTAAVDGTITLTADAQDFYGADGKKVASFNGTTLTKETSSTAITAIDAIALTTAITIDGFYNENTTITAGSGGVNVNVGGNKFSVVGGEFKFDGTTLISGTAKLSAANDAVKVGDNLITLTSGDGITVNATASTIGGLNSGDKFTIGTDSYEVTDNGIIKNDNFVHVTADTLAINDTSWTTATIITDTITLGSDTIYTDSTAKQIAKLENGTLTAIDATDAAKLTVDVGTGKEYTLGKEFGNLKSGDNSFKVTAGGDYKVNGTTITLANVESIEIGGVNYSVDAEKISKTISGNTYHLATGDTVTTSALISDDNWKLHSGTVTVTDSLTTTDGKTLTVVDDSDGVTVTVADGAITSITGLASGGSVTYDGKTYKHALTLPDNVTATGDKLEIDGKNYYATGTTVTVSGFTGGEISFDDAITSIATSGTGIVAKVGEDAALTISGLTYPSENGNDWTVSGTSANYLKKFTGGAVISGEKIIYQPASNEILIKVENVPDGATISDAAIEVSGNAVTVKSADLVGAKITAEGYSIDVDSTLKGDSNITVGWNGTSYYTAGGSSKDYYTIVDGTITKNDAATPAVTISGLNGTPSSSNITVGDKKLTINDAALLKDGNMISATNNYTVELATSLKPSDSVSVGWSGNSYYSASGYKTGGWTLDNGTVSQIAATAPAVTISGLNGTPNTTNITVGDKKLTINDAALLKDGNTISATNNYTVELATSLKPSDSVSVGWSGNSYYSASGYKTAGWSLSNGKVSQIAATTPAVTISGLNGTPSSSNITVGDKKLTINDAALLTNGATISATNNYTVELATSLAPSGSVSVGWEGSSYYSTAGYKTGGWSLSNGKVSQIAATTPAVTISGLNGTPTASNITVANGKVTINDAALLKNGNTISATNNYAVELASGLAPSDSVSVGWDGSSYYSASGYKTGGWTLSNGKVSQIAATTPAVTISGLNGTPNSSNITVGDKKLTINDAALLKDGNTISATNNYTVELASTLNPKKTAANWSEVSSGKATYTSASTTEGYTLANNKVSYTAATTPKSFTVSGIKSTSGIKVDGTTVTLSAANLNASDVTISDGYTLKLGSDVTAAVESAATLQNGEYTTAGVETTGYKLVDNKISYLTKNRKTITFNGLANGAKASDITVEGNTITLGKNAIPSDGTAVSVETSGYTLATDGLSEVIISDNGTAKKANYYFATDGALPTGYIKTTGSDKKTYYVQEDAKFTEAHAEYGIEVRVVEGTTATYMAAAPSGYTEVIDANGTFYTNAITMSAALTNAAASDNDLVLTAGEESLTVSGAAKKTVKVTAKGIVYKAAAGVLTNTKNNAVTITASYDAGKGYEAAASIKSVNAKKVEENIVINGLATTKIAITGGSGNNKILSGAGDDKLTGGTSKDSLIGGAGNDILYGGNGNDTLWGQAGNDTLIGGVGNDVLIGGAGNDLFAYHSGSDIIIDYAAGDRISIKAAISDSSVKGANATFKIGSGHLTVKNGKGKELSFIEANGTARTIVGGSYLADDTSESQATLDSWREIGDASERTKAIELVGNAKANTILGGSGNDSLYGKNGNDCLVGGAGNDIIYGENGNDTLWGGAGNDTLYGGDGEDTFIYKPGEGTDTIFDYQSGDILQILQSDGTAGGSFTKSSFSGGKLSLTVSGGGKIVFDNVSATDTFNINGATYKISGKTLK